MKTLVHTMFVEALLAFLIPCTSRAADSLDALHQKLSSTNYESRVAAVTEMMEMGDKRPLRKDEVDLLIPHLKSDSDWRIKCRVTLVLPFAANRDWVLQPLVSALQDRGEESSGNGDVPLAACHALVRLGDKRGLQPIQDWLHFLESYPNIYGDLHNPLVNSTKKCLKELKSKVEHDDSTQRWSHHLIRVAGLASKLSDLCESPV